jgi:hypothetical protein
MRNIIALLFLFLLSTASLTSAGQDIPPPPPSGYHEVPPPLPQQKGPGDQKKYEQTLPLPEQIWLRKACHHVEIKRLNAEHTFDNLVSSFTINRQGKITGPISFSVPPSSGRKHTIENLIFNLSPFPPLPSHEPARRITVSFDSANSVEIRLQ